MDAIQALSRLIAGNKRFVEDKSFHPNRSQERRAEILHRQNPFAVIVTCSDSRVAPTIIFDKGLGDVFVVQNAGQVLSKENIGSIEYAVRSLGVRLILVLGHGNCGAVKTALACCGEETSPNLKSLIDGIKPSVEEARKKGGTPEEILDYAIRKNTVIGREKLLASSEILKEYSEKEGLEIHCAYYCLEVGLVEIFDTI